MQLGGRESIRLWAYPVLLAAVALAFDAADRRVPFNILSTGLLDEPAHLATAALGLLVLERFIDVPRRFYVAALIASVAIDLDHIPLYLGLLGNQDQRPVTHSLSTVIVVAIAAVISRRHRAVLAGVATGLVLHFARDLVEGPGVRLFWPLQGTSWKASYWWFLGMIIAFTAVRLLLVNAGTPRAHARLFETKTPLVQFLLPSRPSNAGRSLSTVYKNMASHLVLVPLLIQGGFGPRREHRRRPR